MQDVEGLIIRKCYSQYSHLLAPEHSCVQSVLHMVYGVNYVSVQVTHNSTSLGVDEIIVNIVMNYQKVRALAWGTYVMQ